MKEQRYDPANGLSILKEVVISKCHAQQRAGRAGRVQQGHCWRLYEEELITNPSNNPWISKLVPEFPLPEIQRIAIEEVVLQVLLLKLGRPEVFLGQCLDPPSLSQLKAAIACLIEIKSILPLPSLPLTALGYHLAKMPCDVRLGKMLVYASLVGVLEPALTIAAYLSGKSPFLSPIDKRDEAKRIHIQQFLLGRCTNDNGSSSGTTISSSIPYDSDHIAVIIAYEKWREILFTLGNDAAYRFCKEHFLSMVKLQEMKQLREHY
jgi:HrpA-like RNA helicase